MSYFYGSSLTNLDNHDGKNEKKKHNRQKPSTNEDQLEPIHRSHRRKHSSKSRCMSKNKSISHNIEGNNDCRTPSPKNKHKRHKEVGKLTSDNDLLMAKSSSTPESGFMEELSERDTLLSKYKNKCNKLEKKFQDVQSENSNLQIKLEKRDTKFNELHRHYEELLKHVQSLEQERNDVLGGYKKYVTDNSQLNEDVRLLKILIYRLNVELERYQDKLRVACQKTEDVSTGNSNDDFDTASENKKIAEAWGRVNSHALGPLLEAYQENLIEKDELIKQFRQEIDHFSGRCKEVVAENEELRKDIENLQLQADKFSAEIKTIEDDASIIKEENDILMKQVSLHKQKLNEIHSIYENKVTSMSQDNNKLHGDYIACHAELSNLQGKYEILNDGYEKLKKNTEKTMPVSVHTDAIEECKRLFEELKTQYETEKRKLSNQLKRLEELNPENDRVIATLTAERDHLKYLSKNLEKNSKRSQHKLESVQAALCSIQVSKDSFKRQLAKVTAYCEELVTEQEKLLREKEELSHCLRKREKENESIQYLGDNITQRMGTLKSQLKSVQKGAKEQLETVEKHIKIQELGVGKMKSDYHRELARLRQLIKQKEDVIGKLQRDKYKTQDNLELVWKAATSEEKKVKDVLKNTKIYNV